MILHPTLPADPVRRADLLLDLASMQAQAHARREVEEAERKEAEAERDAAIRRRRNGLYREAFPFSCDEHPEWGTFRHVPDAIAKCAEIGIEITYAQIRHGIRNGRPRCGLHFRRCDARAELATAGETNA